MAREQTRPGYVEPASAKQRPVPASWAYPYRTHRDCSQWGEVSK